MRLAGKIAVVTGAGSGIGRSASVLFAREGAQVIVVDVAGVPATSTADAIGGVAVTGSVDDAALWTQVLHAASELGGLDLAYLNAGVYGHSCPIDELPLEAYRQITGANIDGVVLGTRAVVPSLRERGGGAIVVTASVAGIVAFEPNPVYTMTKQAVTGFVRAVAPGLSADRISIDAVCPGVVDTPMTTGAVGGGGTVKEEGASLIAGIPMISPETIATTALDLALTEGTGRCRAVLSEGRIIDWTYPTFSDLASSD